MTSCEELEGMQVILFLVTVLITVFLLLDALD
jgi:hypothetical protein